MAEPRPIKLAGLALQRSQHVRAFFALRTHPVAIVGDVAHENPFYVPAREFLKVLRARDS
jgi:hypothetical protein